jgi:hypothetical protein
MIACCGRPAAASFCDRFPYIVPRYARETIAETCSLGVALATAIISQTDSSKNDTAQTARSRDPSGPYFSLRPNGVIH